MSRLQWYMTKFPKSFMDRIICVTESFPTSLFTLPDVNPVISVASTSKIERQDLCMTLLTLTYNHRINNFYPAGSLATYILS